MGKGSLTHNTAGHHTPCHRNRFSLVRFKIVFDRLGVRVYGIFHLLVGVFALGYELCEFFTADSRLFNELFFFAYANGRVLVFLHFVKTSMCLIM